MSDALELTISEGIATLTLTRAHSLDVSGKHEIAEALEGLAEDPAVRALVVSAAHPQAFLVDVAELADFNGDQARDFSRSGHRVADGLSALPFPTIAAVSGVAFGGGCELVLACDLAYAADTAQFGQIEVNGGVIPGFGGTWRLPQRVGLQRAYEMIFTGAVIPAGRAKEIGLVLDVVPADQLMSRCMGIAQQIARTSRAAVAAAKKVMVGSVGLPPDRMSALEQPAFAGLFGSEQQARMHAFLESQK